MFDDDGYFLPEYAGFASNLGLPAPPSPEALDELFGAPDDELEAFVAVGAVGAVGAAP